MKVLAIIQARLSSSRLPGKVLLKIKNKTIVETIYDNLKKSKLIDKVLIATSNNVTDEKLVKLCKEKKLNYFAGSLNNVLKRFIDIIKIYKPKYVIRVTADSPIIDLKVLNFYIRNMKKFDSDCFFLSHNTSLLAGYDVYSSSLLKNVYRLSSNKKDKEHVGSFYIKKNIDKFNTLKIVIPKFLRSSKYKLSIDTDKDYKNIKKLIEISKSSKIDLKSLIKIMKKNRKNITNHTNKNESQDNKMLKKIKIVKKKFNNQVSLEL